MEQYEVRMRCVITKLVIVEGCDADEARADPFRYAVEETEVGMSDWEVLDVTPQDA